jgi:hypothetical protein
MIDAVRARRGRATVCPWTPARFGAVSHGMTAVEKRGGQAAPVGEHNIGNDPAGIFAALDLLQTDLANRLRLDGIAGGIAQPALGPASRPEDLGRIDP